MVATRLRLTGDQTFVLYEFLKETEEEFASDGSGLENIASVCSEHLKFDVNANHIKKGIETVGWSYKPIGTVKKESVGSKYDKILVLLEEIKSAVIKE